MLRRLDPPDHRRKVSKFDATIRTELSPDSDSVQWSDTVACVSVACMRAANLDAVEWPNCVGSCRRELQLSKSRIELSQVERSVSVDSID